MEAWVRSTTAELEVWVITGTADPVRVPERVRALGASNGASSQPKLCPSSGQTDGHRNAHALGHRPWHSCAAVHQAAVADAKLMVLSAATMR